MKTPLHIQPEWYFLPYYAILRSIPHKAGGVVTIAGALLVFAFVARKQGREAQGMQNYFPREVLFFVFAFNAVVLGWIGACPLEVPFLQLGLYHTVAYFSYFLLDRIIQKRNN